MAPKGFGDVTSVYQIASIIFVKFKGEGFVHPRNGHTMIPPNFMNIQATLFQHSLAFRGTMELIGHASAQGQFLQFSPFLMCF